jgi:hypothetical protein
MIVTVLGTGILIVAFVILVTGNTKYYVEGDYLVGKPLLVLPPFNPLIKIPIFEIKSVQLTSSRWFSGRRSGWREKKKWYCIITSTTNRSIKFPIYDDSKFADIISKLHHKNPQINWSDNLVDQVENNKVVELPRSRPIPTKIIVYTFVFLLIWFLVVGVPEIMKQLNSY